ncbi:hypothetical protein C8Q80DRAFT_1267616 [Daedaleopsis nitida]|nr:hypothetical protein C8Q80DRAFT_1267616 [Daedaleopsis nitida]
MSSTDKGKGRSGEDVAHILKNGPPDQARDIARARTISVKLSHHLGGAAEKSKAAEVDDTSDEEPLANKIAARLEALSVEQSENGEAEDTSDEEPMVATKTATIYDIDVDFTGWLRDLMSGGIPEPL